MPCKIGTYASLNGSKICNNCSEGEFNNQIGQITCKSCKPGYFQNRTGQSSCLKCKLNYYTPLNHSAKCYSCEYGKFSYFGFEKCIQCEDSANVPIARLASLPMYFIVNDEYPNLAKCYMNCPSGFITNNLTNKCDIGIRESSNGGIIAMAVIFSLIGIAAAVVISYFVYVKCFRNQYLAGPNREGEAENNAGNRVPNPNPEPAQPQEQEEKEHKNDIPEQPFPHRIYEPDVIVPEPIPNPPPVRIPRAHASHIEIPEGTGLDVLRIIRDRYRCNASGKIIMHPVRAIDDQLYEKEELYLYLILHRNHLPGGQLINVQNLNAETIDDEYVLREIQYLDERIRIAEQNQANNNDDN